MYRRLFLVRVALPAVVIVWGGMEYDKLQYVLEFLRDHDFTQVPRHLNPRHKTNLTPVFA
jgi:hypothetical protein